MQGGDTGARDTGARDTGAQGVDVFEVPFRVTVFHKIWSVFAVVGLIFSVHAGSVRTHRLGAVYFWVDAVLTVAAFGLPIIYVMLTRLRPAAIVTPTAIGYLRNAFSARVWIAKEDIARAYYDGFWISLIRAEGAESIDIPGASPDCQRLLDELNRVGESAIDLRSVAPEGWAT